MKNAHSVPEYCIQEVLKEAETCTVYEVVFMLYLFFEGKQDLLVWENQRGKNDQENEKNEKST